jgi:hypothetical protein
MTSSMPRARYNYFTTKDRFKRASRLPARNSYIIYIANIGDICSAYLGAWRANREKLIGMVSRCFVHMKEPLNEKPNTPFAVYVSQLGKRHETL